MQTIKLSQLVLAVSPELYDLLTEAERNASVMVHGALSDINQEQMSWIIQETIAYHQSNGYYH